MSNSQQLNNMGDWVNSQGEPINQSNANNSASGYSYGHMVDVTSPQSSTNPATQGYYQVPIKPMYGLSAIGPQSQSMPAKGNRRQVIQQIIHNNGSGNILFSSGALQHSGLSAGM